MKKHTIDAKGKKLGRIATEVAYKLMGKDSPDYEPQKISNVEVEVINASKLDIGDYLLEKKQYPSYSGYPGGLSFRTGEKVVEKHGFGELVRKAVYGMLPSNKLRAPRMKKLNVRE